jgi:hypothetical protein
MPPTGPFVLFALTENDHARRAVSHLLVLRPAELNHRLGSRMRLAASWSACYAPVLQSALLRTTSISRRMALPSLVSKMPP